MSALVWTLYVQMPDRDDDLMGVFSSLELAKGFAERTTTEGPVTWEWLDDVGHVWGGKIRPQPMTIDGGSMIEGWVIWEVELDPGGAA